MAAVEEEPLLRDEEGGNTRDFDFAGIPDNVRTVFIAFGVLSLLAAFTSAAPVFSLLSLIVSSYIAYYLFTQTLLGRFETGDIYQALGFLKLGIWNTFLKTLWLSILLGIPFMILVALYAGSADWMKDIGEIGEAMSEHGGFQDVEKKDMFVHALNLFHVKPVFMSGVYHYAKFRSQYGSLSGITDDDFDNKIPDVFFKDGTVANPLVAEMFEALSNIPLSFMLIVLFTSQILVNAYPQVQAIKHVASKRILGDITTSFNTVAFGSACLGLGVSMTSYFIFSQSSGPLIFFLSAVFQISIAVIIGITLQKNSETVYTDEKKSVLLKPMLYKAYGGISWGLYGIYVIKNVLPKIANIIDRGFVLPQDCTSFPFMGICAIFIAISQLALIWYVQKEAKKMFSSSEEDII